MPISSEQLLKTLEQWDIDVMTHRHEPLHTVADAQALRGRIAGGHTKNLFLKDKKGGFFLVTVEEDATVDLKTLHRTIGASGRLSFAGAEQLMALLGVAPGSVSVFGVINDGAKKVRVVLDEKLMQHGLINAHPLVNTATITIANADLLRFLAQTHHPPLVLKVAA